MIKLFDLEKKEILECKQEHLGCIIRTHKHIVVYNEDLHKEESKIVKKTRTRKTKEQDK